MDVGSGGVKAVEGHDWGVGCVAVVAADERDQVEAVKEHFALKGCESGHEVKTRASLRSIARRLQKNKAGEVEMTS